MAMGLFLATKETAKHTEQTLKNLSMLETNLHLKFTWPLDTCKRSKENCYFPQLNAVLKSTVNSNLRTKMKQNKYIYEAFKFRRLKPARLVIKMASTGETV